MRRFCWVVACVLLAEVGLVGQAVTPFSIQWQGAAPPQVPGVPPSTAYATNWLPSLAGFFVWLRLGDVPPTGGTVLEAGSGGSLAPVFQLTNLVERWYPPPDGPRAWSYEQAAPLTAAQLDALLASRWYVEVTLPGQTYLGQFVPVPEVGTVWGGVVGGILLVAGSQGRRRRPRERGSAPQL